MIFSFEEEEEEGGVDDHLKYVPGRSGSKISPFAQVIAESNPFVVLAKNIMEDREIWDENFSGTMKEFSLVSWAIDGDDETP